MIERLRIRLEEHLALPLRRRGRRSFARGDVAIEAFDGTSLSARVRDDEDEDERVEETITPASARARSTRPTSTSGGSIPTASAHPVSAHPVSTYPSSAYPVSARPHADSSDSAPTRASSSASGSRTPAGGESNASPISSTASATRTVRAVARTPAPAAAEFANEAGADSSIDTHARGVHGPRRAHLERLHERRLSRGGSRAPSLGREPAPGPGRTPAAADRPFRERIEEALREPFSELGRALRSGVLALDSLGHRVRLRCDPNGRWTASCTCPAFRATRACPHLWATVLEVRVRELPIGEPDPRVERGIRPRPELFIEPSNERNAGSELRCVIHFDYDGARVASDSDSPHAYDPSGGRPVVARDLEAERAALAEFERVGGRLGAGEAPLSSAPRPATESVDGDEASDAGGTNAPISAGAAAPSRSDSAVPDGDVDSSTASLAAEFAPSPEAGERTEAPDHTCIVARALPLVVRSLLSDAWLVQAGETRYRTAGELELHLDEGIDWFELSGGLCFDDEIAELPALLRAIEADETTIELRDGSIGLLPDHGLERLTLLGRLGGVGEHALRFHRSQGALLDAALPDEEACDADAGTRYSLAPTFRALRGRLRDGLSPKRKLEPVSFLGTLRGYQREALGWFEVLRGMSLGGCLADDMGLGKTIQVLALIESRRAEARVDRPSLVVAPRSLTFNWLSEARTFAPELLVLDYSGPDRRRWLPFLAEHDLVVTTYGTLRRDLDEFREQSFDYVVLDEAQAIKNATSHTSRAVRALDADHRLALSGTPIENHLGELASLFDFLNPGLFDPSTRIGALLDRRADLAQETDRELLRRALRPLILRRTKEAVLTELPPRHEQILYCEMGSRQRAEYTELRDYYRSRLLAPNGAEREEAAGDPSRFEVLAALLRLRQAACHPGLIEASRARDASAKLDTLLPLLEEIAGRGHKALVFSQFTTMLSLVRTGIEERGLRCIQLDGSTRDRGALVDEFQSDATLPVFLISLMAGGAGLNLTAADYVFLLDPWWNPAVEAQAIGRAHRMGQQRTVMAYRLIAKDTIEEKVLELQARKRELADIVLGVEAGEGDGRLSLDELAELFD